MIKTVSVLLFCFVLIGCAALDSTEVPVSFDRNVDANNLTLPDGISAEILPHSFNRPTQFTVHDNALWVVELNGPENDAKGQIVRVPLIGGERSIFYAGLDKPTGLAIAEDKLFIATRDEILQGSLDGAAALRVVQDKLPNNGRSNGTLTVTSQGILYETSGNKRDADSGKLWALDPETLEVTELAIGFKGVYAHVEDEFGRIWLTEIADGSLDGVKYPDEINLLSANGNYGWPTCYGRELVGPSCDSVIPAVAVLPTNSTPTSIAISPFADDTLLVTLWLTGEVVQIPYAFQSGNAIGDAIPFASGFRNPQHLVALDDGSLLVSDYTSGQIYRLFRSP